MSSRIEEQGKKTGFIGKYLAQKVSVSILMVFVVIVVGIFGFGKFISSGSKTTKLGFENIGELATQAAYCTQVNDLKASRDLFGIEIPFTQSKQIYSYNIVIKAGFDFGEVEWTMNDTTIEVKLPETKILSSEIDTDSFKAYHEDESIFRPFTLEENNEALAKMKKDAENSAVVNGLLDNARSNGEIILTGFFANVYDMDKYDIKFTNK